jgi:hypothetical protein
MSKYLSILLTNSVQLGLAIALIAWGVAYGYETYRGDQCNQAFDTLATANQGRISNVQARLETVRSREAALQARTGDLVRKSNGPAKDQK